MQIAKKIRGFWSSLKKAFAIWSGNFRYLTLKEARECFKEATHAEQRPRRLETFTPKWEKCFQHWLSLCTSKEDCMDPFFAAFDFQYRNKYNGWAVNPLREAAAMKWLEFILAGEITKKDEGHIWHLSTYHWGQGDSTQSHLLAHQLRDAIATEKIRNTEDPEELNVIGDYASSNGIKALAAKKRDAIRKARKA